MKKWEIIKEAVKNRDRSDCWIATKSLVNGYWYIGFHGRNEYGHRVAFFFEHGYMPLEEVDHICRVRGCWNPSHLEDISHSLNQERARLSKLYCINGHAYEENSIGRRCRICHNEASMKWYNKKVGK